MAYRGSGITRSFRPEIVTTFELNRLRGQMQVSWTDAEITEAETDQKDGLLVWNRTLKRWNYDGELNHGTEITGELSCSKRIPATGCGTDDDDVNQCLRTNSY